MTLQLVLRWAFVILLGTTSVVLSEDILFTTISPKQIRAFSTYKILVTVEPTTKPAAKGSPQPRITFKVELSGVPEPPQDDGGVGIGVELIRPVEAKGVEGTTVATTTTTPKPVPPPQNYTSKELTIPASPQGSSKFITIHVNHLAHSVYNLTIRAMTNTERQFVERAQVFRDTRTRAVMIQTDRPIYKPGDTVRYRVIVLNRNMAPVSSTSASGTDPSLSGEKLSVIIKDSQGNVIRNLQNEQTTGGLYSGSLELSTEPNLGEWKITAIVATRARSGRVQEEEDDGEEGGDEGGDDNGGDDIGDDGIDGDDGDDVVDDDIPDPNSPDSRTTKVHSFTVDRYVLPKFKLELRAHPSFVTYNNSKVRLQVDASYTYGKALEGFVIATMKEPYSNSYIYYDNGTTQEVGPISVVKKSPIKGRAFLEFNPLKELVEPAEKRNRRSMDAWNPPNRYQRNFQIDVSVVDTLTGRIVNGTHTLTMYEHPYRMELIAPPSGYKPGFPLTLRVRVTRQDGTPVHDENPKALTVRHGYSCNPDEGAGLLHFAIPPSGLVSFTVGTPPNELINGVSLEVEYKGQMVTLYPPQKVNSPSHSYIQIEVLTEAKVGEEKSNPVDNTNFNPNQGQGHAKYTMGQKLNFVVRVNKKCAGDSVRVLLYGQGEVLEEGKTATRVTPRAGAKSRLQEFQGHLPPLPAKAAPEATLIAYCTLSQSPNELIADSVKLYSDTHFRNKLALHFTKGVNATMEPGENATLRIESTPGSLVALRGLDQSVLVLKHDNDIDRAKINAEMRRFQQGWTQQRVWGGSVAFQIFEEAGIVILTNAKLERQHWIRPWRPFRRNGGLMFAGAGGRSGFRAMGMAKAAPMMMMEEFDAAEMPVGAAVSNFAAMSAPTIRVRQHFPESWLWEELTLNSSTSLLHTATVPDTITSWFVTGYSLHPEAGIALSDPSPTVLRVFRPFFVTLNVPYSVVKGETLALQVLVHNYLDGKPGAPATVTVTLNNVDNTLAFNEHVNMYRTNDAKIVRVGSGTVTSVIFPVTPIKFGTITLSIKATASSDAAAVAAGDAIQQPLIVRPPGIQKTRTAALLLNGDFDGSLTASFPHERAARGHGADVLKVIIVGDLLGPTIHNLDRLLAMPTGCGEQNMLNFVPDIVILNYLNTTGGLTPEIRDRAVRYLEHGYQRQLTYRRLDGSFSAFGPSDPHGSTWLTAFVVRSFLQASNSGYITVDPAVVIQALQYLVAHQHTDGSFIDLGQLLHAEMAGGGGAAVGNSLAITSYVLLAFNEGRESKMLNSTRHEIHFEEIITRALGFLLESYPVARNDTYTVALLNHVFATLNDTGTERGEEFFQDLQKLAIIDEESGTMHWDSTPKPYPLPPPDIGPEGPEPIPLMDVIHAHPQTRPATVEMTSYALLTHLARDDLTTSLKIVRWLLQQQNTFGGFISTQDTVVGLTALAKFAEATHVKAGNEQTDMNIKIKHVVEGSGAEEEETCKVDSSNAIVLREFQFKMDVAQSDNQTVQLHAEGKGNALAVLSWSYFVEKVEQEPAFEVDMTVENVGKSSTEAETTDGEGDGGAGGTMSLRICTRFLPGNQSNMVVQEVNLPSGYMFAQEDVRTGALIHKVAHLKRVDLEAVGGQLQLYYDFMLRNQTNCITLEAARVYRIANPARAFVHVYDYYEPDLSSIVYYEPPNPLGPCDLCGNEVDFDGGTKCRVQNC